MCRPLPKHGIVGSPRRIYLVSGFTLMKLHITALLRRCCAVHVINGPCVRSGTPLASIRQEARSIANPWFFMTATQMKGSRRSGVRPHSSFKARGLWQLQGCNALVRLALDRCVMCTSPCMAWAAEHSASFLVLQATPLWLNHAGSAALMSGLAQMLSNPHRRFALHPSQYPGRNGYTDRGGRHIHANCN